MFNQKTSLYFGQGNSTKTKAKENRENQKRWILTITNKNTESLDSRPWQKINHVISLKMENCLCTYSTGKRILTDILGQGWPPEQTLEEGCGTVDTAMSVKTRGVDPVKNFWPDPHGNIAPIRGSYTRVWLPLLRSEHQRHPRLVSQGDRIVLFSGGLSEVENCHDIFPPVWLDWFVWFDFYSERLTKVQKG